MTKGTSVTKQVVVTRKTVDSETTGKRKSNRRPMFETVEKMRRGRRRSNKKKKKKREERRKKCVLSVVAEHELIEGLLPTPSSEKKAVIVEVPEEVDMENYCTECGVAMGIMNPRQLCGKWECRGYGFSE